MQIVIGTRAGGQNGWLGMLWMLVNLQSAMLPYKQHQGHARLIAMKLSDNQLYSKRMDWQGESTQYCKKSRNSSISEVMLS